MKGGIILLSIGEKIKEARLAKGLTLQELANSSGLSHSVISKYENNKIQNISTINIEKLAKALDVDLVYFMGRSVEESPQKKLIDKLINLTSNDYISWQPNLPDNLNFTDKTAMHFNDLSDKYSPKHSLKYHEFYFYYSNKNTVYITTKFEIDTNTFIYTLSVGDTVHEKFTPEMNTIIKISFLADNKIVDDVEYLYNLASGEMSSDSFIYSLMSDLEDLQD